MLIIFTHSDRVNLPRRVGLRSKTRAPHVGKRSSEIGCHHFDNRVTPAKPPLSLNDTMSDVPAKQDEFVVHRPRRRYARGCDMRLQLLKEANVLWRGLYGNGGCSFFHGLGETYARPRERSTDEDEVRTGHAKLPVVKAAGHGTAGKGCATRPGFGS